MGKMYVPTPGRKKNKRSHSNILEHLVYTYLIHL